MPDDQSHLDEIERRILYLLQDDARNTTNSEISDELDVSATTVGQRIDALEDEGIIKNYSAAIDYEKVGFPHRILLFCTVDPSERHETAVAIADERGVTNVRELITGNRNLHVEIVGRTRDEIVEEITAIEKQGVKVEKSEMVKNEFSPPLDEFGPDDEE